MISTAAVIITTDCMVKKLQFEIISTKTHYLMYFYFSSDYGVLHTQLNCKFFRGAAISSKTNF